MPVTLKWMLLTVRSIPNNGFQLGNPAGHRTSGRKATRQAGLRNDPESPLFLPVCRRHPGVSIHGDRVAQSGDVGTVPDPGVCEFRWSFHSAGRRIPGPAAGGRLCRRGGGAVPVRRHDA